jgi:hypothetical protein
MKNNLLFLIPIFFIFSNCTGPEKETVAHADTLTIRFPNSPAKTIHSAPDSTRKQQVFTKTDSQSYYVLGNYFSNTAQKPYRSEVQVVDSTCAVLIYPTAEQLKALQEALGADFDLLIDDNTYYQGLAIEMLDSIDVETINAEKRFITFKGEKSGTWTLDIRKQGAPAWNLIFFKASKEPRVVPMADLSHQKIIDYFEVGVREQP